MAWAFRQPGWRTRPRRRRCPWCRRTNSRRRHNTCRDGLAQMSHAGSHLPGANHWQFDIDVDRRVCHEPATEFPIELRGNQVGQGSSQERAGADPPLPAAQSRRGLAPAVAAHQALLARIRSQQTPIRGSHRVLYPSRYISSPGPVESCLGGAAPLYWSRPCTASAQLPRLSADNLDHFQAYPR